MDEIEKLTVKKFSDKWARFFAGKAPGLLAELNTDVYKLIDQARREEREKISDLIGDHLGGYARMEANMGNRATHDKLIKVMELLTS